MCVPLIYINWRNFDERNIALLSRLIPQNILLVLECGGKDKLAVYYKKLMQTEWKVLDEQRFELTGLDLDAIWQNIIASIGGIHIEAGRTLDEQLELNEKKQKLKREIMKYEKLARKERQPRRKYEYVQKLKKLQEK